MGVNGGKGGVQVQVLLDDVEEVVPRHVEDRLAPRDGHDLALHAEDRLAVGELDVEAVACEGEDLLLEDERLRLLGRELWEDADRVLGRRERGGRYGHVHFC